MKWNYSYCNFDPNLKICVMISKNGQNWAVFCKNWKDYFDFNKKKKTLLFPKSKFRWLVPIFFVRQKWGLIRFDLAVSIDGYDQEKLSYLKRVESQKEVVANNPVKAELEVKKVEKKGISMFSKK